MITSSWNAIFRPFWQVNDLLGVIAVRLVHREMIRIYVNTSTILWAVSVSFAFPFATFVMIKVRVWSLGDMILGATMSYNIGRHMYVTWHS